MGARVVANAFGFNRIAGYDAYFRFGYPLSGFGVDTGCSYPSSAERWAALEKLENHLTESARDEWSDAIERAFKRGAETKGQD
jgi:hypothetical protein